MSRAPPSPPSPHPQPPQMEVDPSGCGCGCGEESDRIRQLIPFESPPRELYWQMQYFFGYMPPSPRMMPRSPPSQPLVQPQQPGPMDIDPPADGGDVPWSEMQPSLPSPPPMSGPCFSWSSLQFSEYCNPCSPQTQSPVWSVTLWNFDETISPPQIDPCSTQIDHAAPAPVARSIRLVSMVWQHFTKDKDGGAAYCNYCSQGFKIRGTSHLRRHLRAHYCLEKKLNIECRYSAASKIVDNILGTGMKSQRKQMPSSQEVGILNRLWRLTEEKCLLIGCENQQQVYMMLNKKFL
ncbi:uncharacterized protein [Triticum aestivum]|uniref:uncharacterized protein isoform X1 n=1 Tax=Triticum aestivum TaxID=4565 RepID=UPI001D002521|nr:uncharacterized protein LOC123115442 isoform X1 [Triticum aestivum]